MHRSVRTVCILALWGMFSLIAVQAQNHTSYLLPGDEIEWKAFGKIDPWGLPPNATKGGDKDGAVYLGSVGSDRIGCGVVPYDRDGDIWMVPAKDDDFRSVGYLLPRGEYDSKSDNSIADCVLRGALEEGEFVIDKDSLIPLGLSNNEAVYWFRGSIIGLDKPKKSDESDESDEPDKLDELDEPRTNPVRWYSIGKARTELKKPKDDPKKKAAMRQALLHAQLAGRSRSPKASSK
ncbi:hypothetical protein CH063_00477 [Colletotrichum higginsianum]|uniref:Nudix domain-containing protein n=2 Tax=Colletotrichum higginsianum TaxID=80884 RepID=H1VTA3_COLHI|nr:Nudix domain-containing protein [Colletotrichum higginsianum IMI 349063]OBR13426.1 Nudix domain-containing protein [Colletotrichum higginsianum IMI 349063]TID01504.1 hypothetical protein CH35J_003657 [Colletotrichum higginsianum]GJC95901.1 NUdix domain-containing protein [Colletotrichum higginsianum]CCF43461.1 hypothetical protein CH063_00477 [Colletotrichum higginsianum]